MKAKELRLLQTSRTGVAESGSDWGLYDWRVIRDRNRHFLSSTAFGLALGPEVILPKRNQDSIPRVSSGLRVNLYTHSPISSSCLDTQLGRGQLHLYLYCHTPHQYAPIPPPTGKQSSWVSEPGRIRALITDPLPVLCCVPSLSNLQDEVSERASSNATCEKVLCLRTSQFWKPVRQLKLSNGQTSHYDSQ
jgi:hypothetical protein